MSWLDEFKERRAKERTSVKFILDIPYAVLDMERGPGSPSESNAILTRVLLQNAVDARFPQVRNAQGKIEGGIKGTDRKVWGRLHRDMLKVSDGEAVPPYLGKDPAEARERQEKLREAHVGASIEIDEVALDFVRESLEKWEAPSGYAGYVVTLEEHLDAIKDEARAAKDEARAAKDAAKEAAKKNGTQVPEKRAKEKV